MYFDLYLLERIYELINYGVKIWIKDNDIQVFVRSNILFTEEQKDFIKQNKNAIFECLKYNEVYSKEYDLIILKSKLNNMPLSFAQQRLWFIEQYTKGTSAYNVPMVFRLASDINLDVLIKSIKKITIRHDILRTIIKEDSNGNNYQLVLEHKEYPLNIENIEINTLIELDQVLSRQINHIYDLSNEYPIKICLYKLYNNNNIQAYNKEYYLSIVVHHIAFDGWSTDIFMKELRASYDYYLSCSQGIVSKLELPDLTIQYRDFALWQKNYLNSARLEKQLNFWKNKFWISKSNRKNSILTFSTTQKSVSELYSF